MQYKTSQSVLLITLLTTSGFAHKAYETVKYPHAVAADEFILKKSAPIPIDESDRIKTCPAGFQWSGGDCSKEVSTNPDIHCPKGFNRIPSKESPFGVQCEKLSSKTFRCPTGYTKNDGTCVRTHDVESELVCPKDFAFTTDGRQCVKLVQLGPTTYCPSGSTRRAESCVRRLESPTQLVCSPKFTLKGRRCFLEETYDCTPETPNYPPVTVVESHHKKKLRMLGTKKHPTTMPYAPIVIPPPTIIEPASRAKVRDFIIGTTCKRTKSEDARVSCAVGGAILTGQGCFIEEIGPALIKVGGFSEEFATPLRRCPEGYSPGSAGRCFARYEANPEFFCPLGTESRENNCVAYRKPHSVCPEKFSLANALCVRTIIAPPIVEFTVTYSCIGKDCAN